MIKATHEAIRTANDDLYARQCAYLKRFGWKETCNTPGSFWLWQRDFADEDQKRLEWWEAICRNKPPLGNPSKPRPYGVITANTDMVVLMTSRCLDRDDEEAEAEAAE